MYEICEGFPFWVTRPPLAEVPFPQTYVDMNEVNQAPPPQAIDRLNNGIELVVPWQRSGE